MPGPNDLSRNRGGIVKGVVLALDDTGEVQTIDVQTHDGVIRTGVEVMSIHGLPSNPGAGAEALLLAVEGDQGHYVALPLQNIGVRFGGMAPGGAGVVDDAGNRLVFPADGSGTLTVAGLLTMLAQTMTLSAPGGITIHGPVTFTDDVTFQGEATFQKDVTIAGALHVGGPVTGASFNGR